MIFLVRRPPEFSPPGWGEYGDRVNVAAQTSLFERAAVVNRFYARYRLARAFRGMTLEGYSAATTEGYNALTKVSLHWSAFEQLKRALRLQDSRELARKYEYSNYLGQIRLADPDGKFFNFVVEQLDADALKKPVGDFLKGESCNTLVLAKSVRHIFLHGPLTPNVKGLAPATVTSICDALSQSLTEIMDHEFSLRVQDLKAIYP